MNAANKTVHRKSIERRRERRIKIAFPCCLIFSDGAILECKSIDVSLESVALKVSKTAAIGERAIVDIEGFGRVDGVVVRTASDLVVLTVNLSERRRGRFLRRIDVFNSIATKVLEDAGV